MILLLFLIGFLNIVVNRIQHFQNDVSAPFVCLQTNNMLVCLHANKPFVCLQTHKGFVCLQTNKHFVCLQTNKPFVYLLELFFHSDANKNVFLNRILGASFIL